MGMVRRKTSTAAARFATVSYASSARETPESSVASGSARSAAFSSADWNAAAVSETDGEREVAWGSGFGFKFVFALAEDGLDVAVHAGHQGVGGGEKAVGEFEVFGDGGAAALQLPEADLQVGDGVVLQADFFAEEGAALVFVFGQAGAHNFGKGGMARRRPSARRPQGPQTKPRGRTLRPGPRRPGPARIRERRRRRRVRRSGFEVTMMCIGGGGWEGWGCFVV